MSALREIQKRPPNREFESLTQVPFPGGVCRVWRTEESWEVACNSAQYDIHDCVAAHWPNMVALGLALEALPRVSAIAITDGNGNGATLYPDWK